MSSSLFDSDARRGVNWKFPLIVVVVLAIVGGGAAALYYRSKPKPRSAAEIRAEELSAIAVSVISQPTFSGEEFAAQILGKGRLQWFDRKKEEVYFSYPEADQTEFDEYLARYFVKPQKVEYGVKTGEIMRIGDYSLRVSPFTAYFWKSDLRNFRIDPDQQLKFDFKNGGYTLSLDELKEFIDGSRVYGGRLIAEAPTERRKPKIVFANHGIMVAKPNEPSLQRFVESLLSDEAVRSNREKRIQRLVDFVSNEIEYSMTEAVSPRELLKRPNEVLMTRLGDCSNKTILLASLLEQIGEEYILLYCPQHITVAVPQGEFPNDNKLAFVYENKNYVIAETTVPGFEVGRTMVEGSDRLINVDYVQSPRQIDLIFDARAFTYLNFL
jgi:hypothetical protein